MGLKWSEARAIALALDDARPGVNPRFFDLSDLRAWVSVLDGFGDDPAGGAEPLLEAIQTARIEERE